MEKQKLLLISANRFAIPYPVYPLGVSYLLSYLEERLPEMDIRVFDVNLHPTEELIQYLLDFQPTYTGVSLRNVDDVNSMARESFLAGYKEITDLIRKTIHTTLIIGGSAFSIFPEDLFAYYAPDYGVHGEGEESLLRLLKSFATGKPDLQIEGLVYRQNGKIRVNERKHFQHALALSFSSDMVDFYWDRSGMMNVQTKRGCPYNCIYCTYPLIEGSEVRTLNADKIVESLRHLYADRHVDYVFFTDSVFNLDKAFNLELIDKILRSGIQMKWGAYFSPHNLTRQEMELYIRSGLTHIEFGTESLSDSTLKHYRKHFTVDEVVEVSAICNELHVYFAHFLILGGYGETEESLNEGFENSKRIHDSVFFPYVGMRIYPHTRLCELALAEGYLSPDEPLIEPVYYIAGGIDYSTLKKRADLTGKRWVFPDEDVVTFMNRLRKRNRKGSLWHHLKK